MKRSTGVTVAGALLIAGGIFVGFGAIMGALTEVMMQNVSLADLPKTEVPLAATIFVFGWEAACAAWAIVTAIGIFRLRHWAWLSVLILSGVMTGLSGLALMGIIVALPAIRAAPAPQGVPEGFMTIAMTGAMAVFLIPLGCGIWWLVLFTRKSVRLQFAGSPQLGMLQGPLTAGVPAVVDFAASQTARLKIPVSILAIAIYLVAFVPFFPLALVMPYMRRMPVMLFGLFVWQGHAWIYMLAIGLAHLAIGVGLLTRRKWAWIWACLYALFMLANSLGTVATPHSFDRMIELLRQAIPELAQSFTAMPGLRGVFYFGMVPGLGLPIVGLYFLWTRREAYRAACVAQ